MIAVDPRDPRHLVVSYHQVIVDSSTRVHYGKHADVRTAWSVDGGATWALGRGTTDDGHEISVDASATIDLHGHAFLSYLAFDPSRAVIRSPELPNPSGAMRNTPPTGVYVRRSLDGGRTWEAHATALIEYPAVQDPPFQDKGYLISDTYPASPHAGNLYVGWTSYSLDRSEILFARSTDDGKSWSRPMTISTTPGVPRPSVSGSLVGFHAAVGRDGTVYAIWPDGQAIVLAVSRDGGRTFEPSRRIIPTKSFSLFTELTGFPFANGLPAIAVDSRGSPGRLFVVWSDDLDGDIDVLASTSGDGGRTWTPPILVNNDARHNGKDQVLSWVTVDQSDGAAYVIFYDRRDDPKNLLPTVTLARSTDGGRTFTNYAWSVTPSDPKRANHGDYIGVAALNGQVYGAWVDNAPRGEGLDAPVSPYFASGPAVIRIGSANFRSAPRNTRGARR